MITLRDWAKENKPELLEEWSEKNQSLTPDQFGFSSHQLVWWVGRCGHEWQAQIKARTIGNGCPYCAGKKVLVGFNDLKSVAPEIAHQWSDRNLPAQPEEFSFKSDKKVWWNGDCGHEWQTSVKNRVNGTGCPYCSGNQVLAGFNDLRTKNPELAKEWSRKNTELRPSMVLPMSNKSVLWKCSTCGYEWMARIAERSRGSKCPVCAGHRIVAGINDLTTTNPYIAAEWSEKNQKVDIKGISKNSRDRVWWKCRNCGHEWRAAVDYRCRGHHCPACSKSERQKEAREKRRLIELAKRFRKEFIDELLQYYDERNDLKLIRNDTSAIGIPVKYFFPNHNAILEISGLSAVENRKREGVKNSLCNRNNIWMIRLLFNEEPAYDDCICIELESDAEEEQYQAIMTVFEMLKIPAEADWEKDIKTLFEAFQKEYAVKL